MLVEGREAEATLESSIEVPQSFARNGLANPIPILNSN